MPTAVLGDTLPEGKHALLCAAPPLPLDGEGDGAPHDDVLGLAVERGVGR